MINAAEFDADNSITISYVVSKDGSTALGLYNKLKKNFSGQSFQYVDLSRDTIKSDSDLYIVAGPQAFNSIIKSNIKAPIIATFISSVIYHKILKNNKHSQNSNSLTAIFSDASIHQQIAVSKAIFPKRLNIGVITNETTYYVEELINSNKNNLPSINFVDYQKGNQIIESLNNIKDTNVLIALPNSEIYNKDTLKTVILTVYKRNQALIGFSRSFTESGGLATAYIEVDDIEQETIMSLRYFMEKKKLPPEKYPKNFHVYVNNHVAKSLNIVLPENKTIKERAELFWGKCCDQ